MHPIAWLENNAYGFKELSQEEREAISHFTFLWSLFEAQALDAEASARAIQGLVQQWEAAGKLDLKPFAASLTYFQQRYFNGGMETFHFAHLNLRRNDQPALVSSVLAGSNSTTADCISSLLIVVYRLRNNLLHGLKWAYGIKGQLQNLLHANSVLMAALNQQCAMIAHANSVERYSLRAALAGSLRTPSAHQFHVEQLHR